jgi:hypothetical protein
LEAVELFGVDAAASVHFAVELGGAGLDVVVPDAFVVVIAGTRLLLFAGACYQRSNLVLDRQYLDLGVDLGVRAGDRPTPGFGQPHLAGTIMLRWSQ